MEWFWFRLQGRTRARLGNEALKRRVGKQTLGGGERGSQSEVIRYAFVFDVLLCMCMCMASVFVAPTTTPDVFSPLARDLRLTQPEFFLVVLRATRSGSIFFVGCESYGRAERAGGRGLVFAMKR